MSELITIELMVSSRDESTLSRVEGALKELHVERSRTARSLDPVTVIAVTAGVLKIVNELVKLKKQLSDRDETVEVTVRSEDGHTLDLAESTAEQIHRWIKEFAAP